ncbi:MAG: hypothetical protein CL691_03945 [Cellvibrionales bacterium]|nr:hypothetical protein [Cellvibrionales bacterium]
MKKFNMSVLAIAIAASASSNAALVFDYSDRGGASYGENQYNKTVTFDNADYTLNASGLTTGMKLAAQPNNQGLGANATNGNWWIGDGEAIVFTLKDSIGNEVDFNFVGFDTGAANAQNKITYNERAVIQLNGNDYAVGGFNPATTPITGANAMGTNPLYPNDRGSQHDWSNEAASSTVKITGAASTNSSVITKYRIKSVSLELAPATAVPVPAAAWLFGSALMGLTVAKRRK